MAAPNIVGVTNILGSTAAVAATTSGATVVTNSAASGKVYKINSVIVANIDGTNVADVTVALSRGVSGTPTNYPLVSTVAVPADATLVALSKDMGIYLEEDDALVATASADGDLVVICSYEAIS